MALVRVFGHANGVAVMYPNLRLRQEGESDVACHKRLCERDAGVSGFAGLPYIDMEDSALPPRETRNSWRLVDGQLVVGG